MGRVEQYVEDLHNRLKTICDNPPHEASLRELSLILRDLSGGVLGSLRDPTGLRAPAPVPDLEQGQEVELVIRVRGRVTDVGTDHGRCYQLQLEQRSYYEGRTVYIDHNEIVAARIK